MRDIIEMARIAGVRDDGHRFEFSEYKYFERFVELVRADAIAGEREACAKVCDDWPNGRDDVYSIGVAIRVRSKT
jgi:hypothetical protein